MKRRICNLILKGVIICLVWQQAGWAYFYSAYSLRPLSYQDRSKALESLEQVLKETDTAGIKGIIFVFDIGGTITGWDADKVNQLGGFPEVSKSLAGLLQHGYYLGAPDFPEVATLLARHQHKLAFISTATLEEMLALMHEKMKIPSLDAVTLIVAKKSNAGYIPELHKMGIYGITSEVSSTDGLTAALKGASKSTAIFLNAAPKTEIVKLDEITAILGAQPVIAIGDREEDYAWTETLPNAVGAPVASITNDSRNYMAGTIETCLKKLIANKRNARFTDSNYAVTTIDELCDAVSAIINTKRRHGFRARYNSKISIEALSEILDEIRIKKDFFEAQDLVFEWANKFLYDYRYDATVVKVVEAIAWRKLPAPGFRRLTYDINASTSIINNPNAFSETPLALYELIWAGQHEEGFSTYNTSLSEALSAILVQLKKDYSPTYLRREVQKAKDALEVLDAKRQRIITQLHEGRRNTRRINGLEEDLRAVDTDINVMQERSKSLMQVESAMAMLEAQYEVNETWKTLPAATKARIAGLKRTWTPTWQLLFGTLYSPDSANKSKTINLFVGGTIHPQQEILSAI